LPLQLESKRRNNNDFHDSFDNQLDVVLINEKQWAYLQRWYHITPRELEVAMLACSGSTNEEIAKILRMRVGTVKTHLKSIFNKTRSKNKISLLLKFVADANKIFGI